MTQHNNAIPATNHHQEPRDRVSSIRRAAGWTCDPEGWVSPDRIHKDVWSDYYPMPEEDGYPELAAERQREIEQLGDYVIFDFESGTYFRASNACAIKWSDLNTSRQVDFEEGSDTDRITIADIFGVRLAPSKFPI